MLFALRKETVEPVFGITKPVMGLRHPATRDGEGNRGMAAGVPGVEFETHGRVVPEISPMRLKCTEVHSNSEKTEP